MTAENICLKIKNADKKHRPVLIGIEGYGGAGKTTFAKKLARGLGNAYIVSIDDFIVKEKLTEPSWDNGGFDRKRLEEQVLKPIALGRVAKYQKLIWVDDSLSDYVEIPPVDFVIVEGISSYHPNVARYYDYKIWVDTPMNIAQERGRARDGSNNNAQFWDLWAANDLRYQEAYHPELKADFRLDDEVQQQKVTT